MGKMPDLAFLSTELGPTLISISSSANIAKKATSPTLSLCLSSLCVADRGISWQEGVIQLRVLIDHWSSGPSELVQHFRL